jgi:hypothetical protein
VWLKNRETIENKGKMGIFGKFNQAGNCASGDGMAQFNDFGAGLGTVEKTERRRNLLALLAPGQASQTWRVRVFYFNSGLPELHNQLCSKQARAPGKSQSNFPARKQYRARAGVSKSDGTNSPRTARGMISFWRNRTLITNKPRSGAASALRLAGRCCAW